MRLSAKCHRATLDHGLEFCQSLGCRYKNSLVAVDLLGGLPESWIGNRERQVHVAFLKCVVVRQRVFVLRISTQDDVMLLGRRNRMFRGNVFGSLQHRMPAERVTLEAVDDDVLGNTGPAGRLWRGIVGVRPVRTTVGRRSQHCLRQSARDFHGCQDRCPYTRCADLRQSGTWRLWRAEQSHEPWSAIKGLVLIDRHTEHAGIEYLRVNVAPLEFPAGDVRREFDCVQVL